MNQIEYDGLITFHPGYYIKDMIEEQNITRSELAEKMQVSKKYLDDIIDGNINLTEEMAKKLSELFGTSISLWINLNKSFIEKKAEIEKKKPMNMNAV